MHKYVCNTSIIFFSFPPISTFSCIKGHLGTAHLFYCFLQLFLVLLFCRRLSYLVEEVTFKFFQGFKRVRTKPQCFSVSFPGGVVVKNPPASAGDARDTGSMLGLGRSPGEGNGNPLQCSCLENPRDGGAWWAAVYGVIQSWDTTEAT